MAKRQRLLLTGASGFVGRQVASQLGDEYEIHVTSLSGVTDAQVHRVDLTDAESCAEIIAFLRPDLLIHCAWIGEHGTFWETPENDRWLEAGKALFTAFAECGGRRIVACGSCAEYPGASSVARSENETIASIAPASAYGRAKLALADHLRDIGIDYAWARIFMPFGEGEDPRRLVPSIARALLEGRPARCSSGRQIRDFIDVRDLGRALVMLAGSNVEGIVNVGSGTRTSIADVARELGRIAGRPDLIELGALDDRRGEPQVLVPDLTRQRDELGYRPSVDLTTGLRHAFDYWSRSR